MPATSELSHALAGFKAQRGSELSSRECEILNTLRDDENVSQAWRAMIDGDFTGDIQILDILLESKKLAEVNKNAKKIGLEIRSSYDHIIDCATDLAKFYETLNLLRPGVGSSPSIIQMISKQNEFILTCRNILGLIKNDVAQHAARVQKFHTNSLPKSQKRVGVDAERVAFGKIYSRLLVFYFGRPFDNLVTSVSSALYPSNEARSLEATKKARSRDRSARDKCTP